MGQVVTTITADGSQMVNEQKKVAESAAEIAARYRNVNKEIADLDRAAKKVFKETRTDLERYNQRMDELGKLLKSNKIDQETYNRSAKQARDELNGMKDSAMQMGASIGTSITSAIAGFLSLSTILGVVKKGITDVREESDRLGQQADQRFATLGMLMQVADPKNLREDFAKLSARSLDLLKAGAVPDIQAADRLTFALRSTGLEPDQRTFEALGRTGLVESLDQVVNSVDSLKDAFGRGEVGDTRSILSKGLAASAVSQTTMEAILINSAKAGATAAKLGLSDEEMMAAVATLTDPLGGRAETASDRMRAFFVKIEKLGLSGGTLDQVLDRVAKASQAKGGSLKVLEDAEATQAFDLLMANREVLRQATKDIMAGAGGQSLDEMISVLESDPAQRASILKRKAEGRAAAGEFRTGEGQLEQMRDAIRKADKDVQTAAGYSAWNRWLEGPLSMLWGGGAAGTTARGMLGATDVRPESDILRWRDVAQQAGNAELVDALNNLLELQREANKLAAEMAERDRKRTPKPAVPVPES